MTTLIPIERMLERIERAREDSDAMLFQDLLILGELITKAATLTLVSTIGDEVEQHRYQQYHRLVRATGLGEWAEVATSVVTGPPAAHIIDEAQLEVRSMTQRVGPGEWQYESVSKLADAVAVFVNNSQPPGAKVQGHWWFHDFAKLRNKTRGHGAPGVRHVAKAIHPLETSIRSFIKHFPGFQRDWAYLHRNLSGKYRVSCLNTVEDAFRSLSAANNESLQNGVYVYIGGPRRVDLIDTDPDLSDISIANGSFSKSGYELLSYATGNTTVGDAAPYSREAANLPQSETQGLGILGVIGNVFANLPTPPNGYIRRPKLEDSLEKLLLDDRHPVITLTGRGGVGKTSTALTVLHRLTESKRYFAIIWFSARDIELLREGAKPVRPHVLSERDIANEFVSLVEPSEAKNKKFKSLEYFTRQLTDSQIGNLLIVLDNFETVSSPVDTYNWLDTHIRSPNKILITTRFRDFKGDYPEEVGGMTEEEFERLIEHTAKSLGIQALLDNSFRNELYQESEGHPYVAKVLLGEVAKAGKRVTIERIMAHRDDILPALFERTYAALTPAAQRVFLTLCQWRSTVPLLGLEAVLLRSENERIDVDSAVEELVRSSMVERLESTTAGEVFINVPLVATVFGEKKLDTNVCRDEIAADVRLLHAFGAARRHTVDSGVEPRVRSLFTSVASQIAAGHISFEEMLPVLEYVARGYPPAWFYLADLYEEQDILEKASQSILHCLEDSKEHAVELRRKAWARLVTFRRKEGKPLEEIQALRELISFPGIPYHVVSLNANRINFHIAQGNLPLDDQKSQLIKIAIDAMEKNIEDAGANDLSRLAWLYLNNHNTEQARHYTQRGLALDRGNDYCAKLAEKLNIMW